MRVRTKGIYISLGSNLGNREENIKNAIKLLKKEGLKIIKKSLIYKTQPIEYGKVITPKKKTSRKKWFLNAVIKIGTGLSAKALLNVCQDIEKALGRRRTTKWGPRTIDLDILFYGDEIINDKNLIVPHPEIEKRKFVLMPFREISPDFVHPVLKKNIKELYYGLKDGFKVYKWGELRG